MAAEIRDAVEVQAEIVADIASAVTSAVSTVDDQRAQAQAMMSGVLGAAEGVLHRPGSANAPGVLKGT